MTELKPCPFCGRNKLRYSIKARNCWGRKKYYVAMSCNICHCYGPVVLIDDESLHRSEIERDETFKKKAIEAWNRRVNDEQLDQR